MSMIGYMKRFSSRGPPFECTNTRGTVQTRDQTMSMGGLSRSMQTCAKLLHPNPVLHLTWTTGRVSRSMQTCAKFDWATTALSAVSKQAAAFEHESNNLSNPQERHRLGLQAAWRAWCEVSTSYNENLASQSMSPLHSKGVGFTSGSDYYSVYLMDRASLEVGRYAYGKTPMLGWPKIDGSLCAFDPETLETLESLESTDLDVAYQWTGEYDVRKRPWFLHGRALDLKVNAEWTPPYTDPVRTEDLIVSCVKKLSNDGVAIAGTWLVPSYRMLDD